MEALKAKNGSTVPLIKKKNDNKKEITKLRDSFTLQKLIRDMPLDLGKDQT